MEDIIINSDNNDNSDLENSKKKSKLKIQKNLSNELKLSQLDTVNLELEKSIENMKRIHNANKLKKKLQILKSSYIYSYKSLNIKKIFIFWISIIIAIIFLLLSINSFSNKFLISIPTYGGTLNEGIIGIPRYINPVLANSDSDKDLTKLIFSGLMKKDTNGNVITDLAVSLEKSDDGLTYTLIINKKAKFQDGYPLKADDVVFTINKIQDKELKSPLYLDFEGVTVEKIDDETVVFHLKKPYLYFENSLTVGILPKHILGTLNNDQFSMTDFNTNPVGSGPYKIYNIQKNNNVANEYSLISNHDNLSGRPYINNLNIFIYQNDDSLLEAFNDGIIETTAYLNRDYFKNINNKNIYILESSLPNIFMLSFNSNKNNLFANRSNRSYLANLLNKDQILNDSLGNYYKKEDNFFVGLDNSYQITDKDIKALPASSTLTISTGDTDDLKKVAEQIAENWQKAGIKVNILVYNLNELSDIIKNRDFEILLFGNIIEKDTDLYAFWDSTSRNYPGLNITNYVSKNLDNNLDILRNSIDVLEREKALNNINYELTKELPAIPLYSNNFVYLIKDKNFAKVLQNKIATSLQNYSDRFSDVEEWYKSEERIWKFTYQKKIIEKLSNILN